jgi:hypothetical protein
MRLVAAVPVVCLLVAGCGLSRPDHSKKFVGCLQRGGGRVITSGAQLKAFPTRDLQLGVGAGLDSISYYTIDASAGPGDVRQSLVFVDDPHAAPGSSPMPEPGVLLQRARHGTAGVRAIVAMPPGEDFDDPIEHCEDVAAPGEAFP